MTPSEQMSLLQQMCPAPLSSRGVADSEPREDVWLPHHLAQLMSVYGSGRFAGVIKLFTATGAITVVELTDEVALLGGHDFPVPLWPEERGYIVWADIGDGDYLMVSDEASGGSIVAIDRMHEITEFSAQTAAEVIIGLLESAQPSLGAPPWPFEPEVWSRVL